MVPSAETCSQELNSGTLLMKCPQLRGRGKLQEGRDTSHYLTGFWLQRGSSPALALQLFNSNIQRHAKSESCTQVCVCVCGAGSCLRATRILPPAVSLLTSRVLQNWQLTPASWGLLCFLSAGYPRLSAFLGNCTVTELVGLEETLQPTHFQPLLGGSSNTAGLCS